MGPENHIRPLKLAVGKCFCGVLALDHKDHEIGTMGYE